MWELGLLLPRRSLFGGAISTQEIVALYWFRRLQDATQLPLDAQLAFFLPMDKAAHRDPDGSATTSLYARTFLNPSVPPDPDLQQLVLAAPRLDRDALSDHQTALQAALAITAGETRLLFELFGFSAGSVAVPRTLSLENLSRLYRVTSLARAAKQQVAELVALAGLLSPGNSAAAVESLFTTPKATLGFLDDVKAIKECDSRSMR